MRLIDADAVKGALRNRIGENIDECINNVPTVDVLEQIRQEIEQLYMVDTIYDDVAVVDKADVLRIIDKYR